MNFLPNLFLLRWDIARSLHIEHYPVQTRSKDMGGGWLAFAGSTEAVSKRLAIIGENLADRERSLVDQTLEEAASGGC